jgi:hypothetical protein
MSIYSSHRGEAFYFNPGCSNNLPGKVLLKLNGFLRIQIPGVAYYGGAGGQFLNVCSGTQSVSQFKYPTNFCLSCRT